MEGGREELLAGLGLEPGFPDPHPPYHAWPCGAGHGVQKQGWASFLGRLSFVLNAAFPSPPPMRV